MLGVRDNHSPLKGEAARKVMEKLIRVQTGHLNDEDRKEIEAIKKQEKEAKWEVKWEF